MKRGTKRCEDLARSVVRLSAISSQDGLSVWGDISQSFSISLTKAETLLRWSIQYIINSNVFHIQCVQASLLIRDGGWRLNVCPTPTVSHVTFISKIVQHAGASNFLKENNLLRPTSLLTTISTRQKQTYHCITIFMRNCMKQSIDVGKWHLTEITYQMIRFIRFSVWPGSYTKWT